jgi:Ferritin-like domain
MAQAFADTTHQEEKMVLSTRNDLGVEVREKATALLNQLLADATDLYSQTKQAHWNVKGMQFFQLHELFDTLADSVEDYVDLIAERATSLGGTACGTVRLSAAASRLPEYPLDARNWQAARGGTRSPVLNFGCEFTRRHLCGERDGRRRYRRRLHGGFARSGQAPVAPGVPPHGLARSGFAEISSGKAKTSHIGRPSARWAGSFRNKESTIGKIEASNLGDLPQRHGIHTITQTTRGGAVREDMAQVGVTSVADGFDALQKCRPVKPVGNDILLDGLCEGWPAGMRLKFLQCIE